MKVLIINGSPRLDGNTTVALTEMEKIFQENGIETQTIRVGNKAVRGCVACGSCFKTVNAPSTTSSTKRRRCLRPLTAW